MERHSLRDLRTTECVLHNETMYQRNGVHLYFRNRMQSTPLPQGRCPHIAVESYIGHSAEVLSPIRSPEL
jgi:hypothetical protein